MKTSSASSERMIGNLRAVVPSDADVQSVLHTVKEISAVVDEVVAKDVDRAQFGKDSVVVFVPIVFVSVFISSFPLRLSTDVSWDGVLLSTFLSLFSHYFSLLQQHPHGGVSNPTQT